MSQATIFATAGCTIVGVGAALWKYWPSSDAYEPYVKMPDDTRTINTYIDCSLISNQESLVHGENCKRCITHWTRQRQNYPRAPPRPIHTSYYPGGGYHYCWTYLPQNECGDEGRSFLSQARNWILYTWPMNSEERARHRFPKLALEEEELWLAVMKAHGKNGKEMKAEFKARAEAKAKAEDEARAKADAEAQVKTDAEVEPKIEEEQCMSDEDGETVVVPGAWS